jgi:hypothetical protein
MRARLKDERDLTVGLSTLWAFLDARGLTYKNDSPRRGAGPPGREGGPRGVGSRASPTSTPPASCSSTRPRPRPTWREPADAARAASGCALRCRTTIGRPRPSSRACACPGSPRRSCWTDRSTATPSRLTSRVCSCPNSPSETSSSWTTSAATRGRPAAQRSKRRAYGCCSCRPTAGLQPD